MDVVLLFILNLNLTKKLEREINVDEKKKKTNFLKNLSKI